MVNKSWTRKKSRDWILSYYILEIRDYLEICVLFINYLLII